MSFWIVKRLFTLSSVFLVPDNHDCYFRNLYTMLLFQLVLYDFYSFYNYTIKGIKETQLISISGVHCPDNDKISCVSFQA